MHGLIVAAPASGSGKTLIAAGLIRALRRRGAWIAPFKAGPDYIDRSFLAAAAGPGVECGTLDVWAMRRSTIQAQIARAAARSDWIVVEGVMGLFDGAADGSGSTADLAALLGWPILFIVDAGRQAASVAALVEGFTRHRADLRFAGLLCNRIASERHRRLIERALSENLPPALGFLPYRADLALPSRHLGLVQASELSRLEAVLDGAAALIDQRVDLERLAAACEIAPPASPDDDAPAPPPGHRIALAHDDAFAFAYPHVLDGWRAAGAMVESFSPLAGEAPPREADAIYLPGGYPELHAAAIAANGPFLDGLRAAAAAGVPIYGECGGYMVLGERLIDGDGGSHAMAGLLPLETSFADRRRQLGYRKARAGDGWLAGVWRGHEFHYASIIAEGAPPVLWDARDAEDADLGPVGLRRGSVAGSFIHLIDRVGSS